ncbi:hypothetical protein [Paraburkholderia sp. BL23I1N1]|uniref:hypothetical protein n=1 Tax=Paraburkholderia sp. BL23I1N1 TaxID=1938802 RepID=UPI000E764CAC|nr:hypothetical protein [Paraburkholderia sp. BL23I1N1]
MRRQASNQRLRKRQIVALAELERLLIKDPKPERHVTWRFDTSVAVRLADVGLHTLGQLWSQRLMRSDIEGTAAC